jgi:two-component system NarL family sensor kinase
MADGGSFGRRAAGPELTYSAPAAPTPRSAPPAPVRHAPAEIIPFESAAERSRTSLRALTDELGGIRDQMAELQGLRDSLERVSDWQGRWAASSENLIAVIAAGGVAELQRAIDRLPEQIALLDGGRRIVAANRAWRETVGRTEPGPAMGDDFLGYCERHADRNADAALVAEGLRDIAAGRLARFTHLYAPPGLADARQYRLCVSRFDSGGEPLVILARYDVTALRLLEKQCSRLDETLLRTQEVERMRIGRDLHDATSQMLVVLQLALIRLKSKPHDPEAGAIFGEIEETVDEIHREIRAISYALHPPPLKPGGLVEGLDAMARGFAARTGLAIDFAFEGRARPLAPTAETTLYRLAQEALANVYRHARARHVSLRLVARGGRYVHLVVRDDGIGFDGMAAASTPGVGVTGMRSRIRDLGGRLRIRRLEQGTGVLATLPADV